MKRIMALSLCLFWLSGCGYAICRSFLNTEEQCSKDCTWEPELDAQGQKIPDPYGRPGDYKLKKTCTTNVGKILLP